MKDYIDLIDLIALSEGRTDTNKKNPVYSVILNVYGVISAQCVQEWDIWEEVLEKNDLGFGKLPRPGVENTGAAEISSIIRRFEPLVYGGYALKKKYLTELSGSAEKADEIIRQRNKIYSRSINENGNQKYLVSWSEELIDRLDTAGIPFVMVSSKTKMKMDDDLRLFGYEDKLYSPLEEYGTDRDSADFYRICTEKLCVRADKCAVIESTLTGAEKASECGIGNIFLYDAFGIFQEIANRADSANIIPPNVKVYDSLKDIMKEIETLIPNNIQCFFQKSKKLRNNVPRKNNRINILTQNTSMNTTGKKSLDTVVEESLNKNMGVHNTVEEIKDFIYADSNGRNSKYIPCKTLRLFEDVESGGDVCDKPENIKKD